MFGKGGGLFVGGNGYFQVVVGYDIVEVEIVKCWCVGYIDQGFVGFCGVMYLLV